jgi:lactoylglutathione lyase
MRLAKPHLDIGLFTNDLPAQRAFWADEIGLRLDAELPVGRGWVQHRFDAHDSVVKVNHVVDPLTPRPAGGYTALAIAGSPAGRGGEHPDGQSVRVVEPGTDGVVGIGVTVSTPDPARMMEFYCGAMEFDRVDERTARCGDSMLFVREGQGGSAIADPTGIDELKSPGFRYLTVQIFDADEACTGIQARGGTVVVEPMNIGSVARVGFVSDPDGNWIEISARASLTGVTPG